MWNEKRLFLRNIVDKVFPNVGGGSVLCIHSIVLKISDLVKSKELRNEIAGKRKAKKRPHSVKYAYNHNPNKLAIVVYCFLIKWQTMC